MTYSDLLELVKPVIDSGRFDNGVWSVDHEAWSRLANAVYPEMRASRITDAGPHLTRFAGRCASVPPTNEAEY